MNVGANNSLSSPQSILKLSMVTFLIVQAVRQLVLVNGQAEDKKESRAGQVAAWFTIMLTLIVAAFLYPSGSIPPNRVVGGLIALFLGVMGSGIAMLYDAIKNKDGPEKNRMWFAVAHIIFAVIVLIFLLLTMTK